MEYTIRAIKASEYPLLDEFLYQAIFVPKGIEAPPKSIIQSPELQVYVKDFGKQMSDQGMVAVANGKIVGAVWARIMNDYGHIDDRTPSLAISLLKEYRGLGIGTALMRGMLCALRASGYKRASLSVQKTNYAVRMYRKVGFKVAGEDEEEWIMTCNL